MTTMSSDMNDSMCELMSNYLFRKQYDTRYDKHGTHADILFHQ